MSQPWIKLWKNDLLSSLNYQSLSVYDKGIYNQLILLCRDDEFSGQFCWPNGVPNTIDEIIRGLHPAERERTDLIKKAIDNLLTKNLIFWNANKILEIRKYAEKTGADTRQWSHSGSAVVAQTCSSGRTAPRKSSTKKASLHTEEDKDKDIDKDNTISPEPEKPAPAPHPPKITLNMATYEWEGITPDHKAGWIKAYPAVSIDAELAKMAEWIKANPTRKKTQWHRFAVSWLGRAQDNPRPQQVIGNPTPSPNKKVTCFECNGSGEVGTAAYLRQCHICKGTGVLWRDEEALLRRRKK